MVVGFFLQKTYPSEDAMNTFIQNFNQEIKGTLEGWDRIAVRGTIRTWCCVNGMARYLIRIGVLWKNFGDHVLRILRGHGLIHKIPLQKRYQVSKKAQKIITSFLMLQHASIKQLNA